MPILPLDAPEPFIATVGVMLYPSEDEAPQARAYAAQYLASLLQSHPDKASLFSTEQIQTLFAEAGLPLKDIQSRWYQGIAAGQVFKTYFAIHNTNPERASLSSAIKIAEKTAKKHEQTGSRAFLMECWSNYSSVAHLWAAWELRRGRFSDVPKVGYDLATDFHAFLMEAEIFRRWGETWVHTRAKAVPPLKGDNWRVPDGWQPPEWQKGWPDTGKVPDIIIPKKYLSDLQPAGRPKKKRK